MGRMPPSLCSHLISADVNYGCGLNKDLRDCRLLPRTENYALLGYYTARSGKFLPTFRDNLSAPSSGLGQD